MPSFLLCDALILQGKLSCEDFGGGLRDSPPKMKFECNFHMDFNV